MTTTCPSHYGASGKPDTTNWGLEDIDQWERCSELNVLDKWWSPHEYALQAPPSTIQLPEQLLLIFTLKMIGLCNRAHYLVGHLSEAA